MPILFYYAKPHLLSHKLWLKILILKALSFETIFQALFKPDINAEIEHRSLCHHYLWSQKYNTLSAISGEKMLCCITLNYGDILILLIFWQNSKTKYASSSICIRLSVLLLQWEQIEKIKVYGFQFLKQTFILALLKSWFSVFITIVSLLINSTASSCEYEIVHDPKALLSVQMNCRKFPLLLQCPCFLPYSSARCLSL